MPLATTSKKCKIEKFKELGLEENSDRVDNLNTGITSSFLSSKFSDLTIKTADQELKVHKLVLCAQSEFFSRLFNGDWKETMENTIELKEDDSRAIEAMVHFLYGIEYDCLADADTQMTPMMLNIRVYHVADKYGIIPLKTHATRKFNDAIKACWNKNYFLNGITELYATPALVNKPLRTTLISVVNKHIDELMNEKDFVKVLENVPVFGADITAILIRTRPPNTQYRCPKCNQKSKIHAQWCKPAYCTSCGGFCPDWEPLKIMSL